MLFITPKDQRDALERAAEAKERASLATNGEDRRFWLDMAARWHDLAESSAFIVRLNDFCGSTEPRD